MQILKMDFQSQSAPPVVPVMQSDAQSRFIGIALYNGGTPYKAPDGAVYTVQYRGQGANNFGWYDHVLTGQDTRAAVTVDADSPHIVTLELAEQALRRPGDVHVNLCVMGPDTGYELRTFDIIARVGGAAYPDDVAVQSFFFVTGVSSASWLSYVSLCQAAQQQTAADTATAKAAAETAVKSASSAADSASTASQKASDAATDADRAEAAYKFAEQYANGYYTTAILTLPVDSWTQTDVVWQCDVDCAESTADSAIKGEVLESHSAVALAAGMHDSCESRDGCVRFQADAKPEDEIRVYVSLIKNETGGNT